MLVERIASQSELIRAIVSGYSPCLWGSRTACARVVVDGLAVALLAEHPDEQDDDDE